MKALLPIACSLSLLAPTAHAGDRVDAKREAAPVAQATVVEPAAPVVEPAAPVVEPAAPVVAAVDPAVVKKVKASVEKNLLAAIKKREAKRSKFSRAAPPPSERRVRVEEAPREDAKGETFVTFAVDDRWFGAIDGEWDRDAITGCLYPSSNTIFVKIGDEYRPGAFLTGKRAKDAPEHVCQAKAETPDA